MDRKYWMLSTLVAAVLLFSVAFAFSFSTYLPVPEKAVEKARGYNSPVIFEDSGQLALNPPGLQKIVLIHYKKGFAKPACNNNGVCEPELGENPSCADCKSQDPDPTPTPEPTPDSSCYGFISKGAKWRDTPVDLVIDPDNLDGLTQGFIVGAMEAGANEWDNHTGADIYGSYSIDHGATWDDTYRDGRNEIVFGDYPQSGVIGVTIIWGYFIGKPSSREIVEFDILFDTDFTWGDATLGSNVMDLQNIAVHELGHGFGLGDLYTSACIDETMYGYSDYGETKKRDLAAGDIVGIQELYGG